MLEYPEIHEDYATYASIRENNCVGYTCLSNNEIEVLASRLRTTSSMCKVRRRKPSIGKFNPRKLLTASRKKESATKDGLNALTSI